MPFFSGIEGYAGRIVREAIDEFDPDLFKEASVRYVPPMRQAKLV